MAGIPFKQENGLDDVTKNSVFVMEDDWGGDWWN